MTRLDSSRVFRHGFLAILLGSLLAGTGGCREGRDPQPYESDLGEGGNILLPVDSPIMNAKVARGTAEFPEFRDPAEEVVELGPEDQIRDLIKEFNEYVRDEDYGILVEYFVEHQQDEIGALIEATTSMFTKVDELRAALLEAAPDQEERINGVVDKGLRKDKLTIEVEAVKAVSETKVVAQLPKEDVPALEGFLPELHFELVEEEWYIVEPNLDLRKAKMQTVQGIVEQIDAWIAGLQDGSMTVDQVLSPLEMQIAAAEALETSGGSSGVEDAEDAGDVEDDGDENEPEPEEEAPAEEETAPPPPPEPGG
jgi:hypothetical protein